MILKLLIRINLSKTIKCLKLKQGFKREDILHLSNRVYNNNNNNNFSNSNHNLKDIKNHLNSSINLNNKFNIKLLLIKHNQVIQVEDI